MNTGRLLGQFRYLKATTDETPGAPALPTALARLAIWRIRCLAGRGTSVPAWGKATQIYCPPEWHGNAKIQYVLRGAIEPDLAIAVALVEPGSLVVDVGAHYGAFTLPLARAIGPAGTVIACEPNPAARPILERGLAENRLTNVSVLPYAISDTSANGRLSVPADPSRSSLRDIAGSHYSMEVQVRPLDALLEDRDQPVRLIKIDVEGHELGVLKGASAILQKDRPLVMFEDLPRLRHDVALGRAPADILREFGYSIREFWSGGWRDVTDDEHSSKNLWGIPIV